MEDDLKISGVVSSLLAHVKTINRLISRNSLNRDDAAKLVRCFEDIDSVLKIFDLKKTTRYSSEIEDLIREREHAREQKNFELADRLRDRLVNLGVDVHDKKVKP
jgi:cysteinyl-tRNA synthetase